MKKEDLIDEMEYEIRIMNKNLMKFKESFAKDPMKALEWSDESFQEAADKTIFEGTLADIKQGVHLNLIRDILKERIIRQAKYPTKSTSPVTNLMSLCLNSSLVKVLELISSVKGVES